MPSKTGEKSPQNSKSHTRYYSPIVKDGNEFHPIGDAGHYVGGVLRTVRLRAHWSTATKVLECAVRRTSRPNYIASCIYRMKDFSSLVLQELPQST